MNGLIPNSVNKERIEENFELNGWELSPKEMKTIDSMTNRFKVCDGTSLLEGVQVFLGTFIIPVYIDVILS
jgi:glycerol 2-dehydrogenase (NADP+)